MPINTSKIIVYDFETGGTDPLVHEPIQIAAVLINPKTMDVDESASFNSLMCPPGDEKNWKIEQEALDINKKTIEQIRAAPPRKQVWQAFCDFVDKYRSGNWAPISAGYNIDNFDSKIIARLNGEIGRKKALFSDFMSIDVMKIVFLQFGFTKDLPKYTLDELRKFLGLDITNAHDGLVDAKQTAEILARFMKYYKKLYSFEKFHGSMAIKKEE